MTRDERPNRRTVPRPYPHIDPLDIDWTDDEAGTDPHALSDDPSHRVTIVPEVPSETLAKQLMAMAEAAEPADGGEDVDGGEDFADRPTPVIDFDPFLQMPSVHAPAPPPLELDDPDTVEVSYAYESLPPGGLFPDEAATEPHTVPSFVDATLTEMRDRHAVGDFSGSLGAAENVLAAVPGHGEARRYAESCRATLIGMLTARIGRLDRCPIVAVPQDQIRWLSLDHRAGFLLSLIDGTSTVDEVLDMSGMPRLDALRLVCDLLEQRVLSLEPRR